MRLTFWPRRTFRYLAFLIVALAALAGLSAIIGWYADLAARDSAGKRNPGAPAVGHLGGQAVAIPAEYANFLEYDGDPHFMTRRKGPAPVRTTHSGIRSFGFDISYARLMSEHGAIPGAGPANDEQSRRDVHVGISSNTYYSGDEFPVRLTDSIYSRLGEAYASQGEDVYGLESYAPAAPPPKRQPQAREIYLHRDRDSSVDVYISCGLPAGRVCKMDYSLAPAAKISVVVHFPRHRLPEWESLRSASSRLILGFRTAKITP